MAGYDDGPLGTVAEKIEAALPFGQAVAGPSRSKCVKSWPTYTVFLARPGSPSYPSWSNSDWDNSGSDDMV